MEFAPRAFDFGLCPSEPGVDATLRFTPKKDWRECGLPSATACLVEFDAFGLTRVGCSTLPFSCLASERTSPYALAI